MYILVENELIKKYPYYYEDLRQDNPNVSFPYNPSAELLAERNVFIVKNTSLPEYDSSKQYVEEETPVFDGEQWVKTWRVVDLSQEEIDSFILENNANIARSKMYAYQEESDPLFFKWQRGECDKQEWLDKVQEIRQRFDNV